MIGALATRWPCALVAGTTATGMSRFIDGEYTRYDSTFLWSTCCTQSCGLPELTTIGGFERASHAFTVPTGVGPATVAALTGAALADGATTPPSAIIAAAAVATTAVVVLVALAAVVLAGAPADRRAVAAEVTAENVRFMLMCGYLTVTLGNLCNNSAQLLSVFYVKDASMNPIEQFQLQINELLGRLLHLGSSASSQIAFSFGLF